MSQKDRFRRAVIAGLAALVLSGAALVAAAVWAAANAASLIPTQLVITVSPNLVSYPIGQLTISGTLETRLTNGQSAQPVAGETVKLALASDGNKAITLGSFVTDANGKFSTTATATTPGLVQGEFAGDSTYGWAGGGARFLAASQLPTRVTVEKINPVPYGSTATVTTQVTMELADGTWVPAPGSSVVTRNCPATIGFGWTDSNGEWSATIKAVPPAPGHAECSFFTDGFDEYDWTQSVSSPAFSVPLTTFPTQIASFSPVTGTGPLPLGDIQFAGTAQWVDSAGHAHPYGGAPVQLYLSYEGKDAPQLMSTVVAGKSGAFTFPRLSGYLSGGRLAVGMWEARLAANGNYLAYASPSTNWVAPLALPVSFSHVKITGTGSTRHLTGTLNLPKGRPLHGVKVHLLVDVNGKIRQVATVTTNAKGYFSIAVTAPKHPSQVKYAASFAGLAGNVPAWIGPAGLVTVDKAASSWVRW